MPLQRLLTINAATCPPGTVVYSACAANLPATGGETSSYTYALAFDSLLARPAQTSTAMTSGVSNTDSSTNLHVNDATANLALSSVNSGVHDTIGFKLPIGYGWFNLDNNIPGAQTQPTNRVSQCPPNAKLNAGYEGCPSGVFAYSGAVYDIKRNRMIIWGGGDQDYFGNEIYEVNLTGTPKWTRLTRATDSPVYSSFSTYRDPKTGAAMDCSGAGYNAMRRAQIETIPGGQVIPGFDCATRRRDAKLSPYLWRARLLPRLRSDDFGWDWRDGCMPGGGRVLYVGSRHGQHSECSRQS